MEYLKKRRNIIFLIAIRGLQSAHLNPQFPNDLTYYRLLNKLILHNKLSFKIKRLLTYIRKVEYGNVYYYNGVVYKIEMPLRDEHIAMKYAEVFCNYYYDKGSYYLTHIPESYLDGTFRY